MTEVLLLLFAFVLPLSIAATDIALVAALVAWLLTRPWRRPWPQGERVLMIASLVLLGSWLLASAFADDPLASFAQVRKLYAIAALFAVADRVRAGGTTLATRLALVALAGGVLSALLGLSSFAFARVVESAAFYRLVGVFSNAMTSGNVFATLAVAALGVAILPRAERRTRTLAIAAAAVFVIALVATFTRSSWLAFAAGTAVLLGMTRPRLLAAAAAVALIGFFLAPPEVQQRFASILDPTHPTNAGRVSLRKSGWAAFVERPIVGYGLQDMLELIRSFRRPDWAFEAGHHHNNWVQVAVSTGIVGLFAFIFWMGAVLVTLARRLRDFRRGWAMLGLSVWLAFQVHGLFDWSFGDAEVVDQLFLWLGIALGVSSLGTAPDADRQGLVRSGREVVPF